MGNVSMSIVSTLSPILFLTFRNSYGISFSLLGLLVLINFVTQLSVDLIFSFFSHKFNIAKTVRTMPLLTIAGLLIYGLWSFVFPENVYPGLCIGTVIFSAASGLGEVLISPVIAAIPSDDPDREMSKLHSVFAWGVVGVTLYCTLFLKLFSADYWQFLPITLCVLPLMGFIFSTVSDIPPIATPEKTSGALELLRNKGVWLCVAAIFLGGAAECTMEQWASGYLEHALSIPKIWGDVFGVALFAAMLGLGRSLYAKAGNNIEKILFLCALGSTVCYAVSALTPIPLIGLLTCALTGLCTSMLWPGTLIVASDRYPSGGVFIFALMAAGGDLGASIGPQLVGVVTDTATALPFVGELAAKLGSTPDSLAMKLGLLFGMLFPLAAIPIYAKIKRGKKKS